VAVTLFDQLASAGASPPPADPPPPSEDAPPEGWLTDPRPDLAEDSLFWRRLLLAAFATDGERADGLFGALHGARCCGARLERSGRGFRLTAPVDGDGPVSYLEPAPETGELSTWADDRRGWLLPHREVLTGLLRGPGETA
jgi:hypothetical protein